MEIEKIWDLLAKYERHARSGMYMMAISMIDICLWDIKGKALGLPVYKLLGGARKVIDAYASMLGHSVDPERAAQTALQKKNEGFKAQKWFFRWGLPHGEEGMQKNVDLVRHLREAVGDGYKLMFDAWMSWDVSYVQEMARRIEQYDVHWLEEPLRARDFEGYQTLRDTIPVNMSAGEHIYTRWEAKRWLEAGILGYMQADPDWTGGVSETYKIAHLCEMYGVPLIPHGHGVYAASAIVASQSVSVCPMAEVLLLGMDQRQIFYKEGRMPQNGVITMPDTPGIGISIDESKIESMTEIFTEYKS
jgi:L-alanine-DL-glutamate epimerase-like enolase superfamily enzyme